MKLELLRTIQAARAAGAPLVLLTWLDSGQQQLVRAEDAVPDGDIAQAVTSALRSDRAERREIAGEAVFVQPFNPPLRLAIVGAVHIGQHLASMAQRSGYAVTVIDPRTAFASPARFPDVALSHEWPDTALEIFAPDSRSAIVTLTHDPKLDEPALEQALGSTAFYIGSLGSRRTHAKRVERLKARGFEDAALARIHAPIGLDIGARSPAEIAVSVVSQMTVRLRRPESDA